MKAYVLKLWALLGAWVFFSYALASTHDSDPLNGLMAFHVVTLWPLTTLALLVYYSLRFRNTVAAVIGGLLEAFHLMQLFLGNIQVWLVAFLPLMLISTAILGGLWARHPITEEGK